MIIVIIGQEEDQTTSGRTALMFHIGAGKAALRQADTGNRFSIVRQVLAL
jgi:hypothetical protein